MIAYIRGTLTEKDPTRVVIEAAGVGYELVISLSTYEALPREGAEAKLLTYHCVREDDEILFGFASEQEKEMFVKLTSVSGVGPKIAISILSGSTLGELALAISTNDAKRISSIKGVGKKTAEKICVELRDKVNELEKERAAAYTGLTGQVENLQKQNSDLKAATDLLNSTLKNNAQRGRWGEEQLHRIAELAGMVEHIDFEEQEVNLDGSRPDMVIHLTGGRTVPVDSKGPMNSYMLYLDSTDDESRAKHLAEHGTERLQLREREDVLADRPLEKDGVSRLRIDRRLADEVQRLRDVLDLHVLRIGLGNACRRQGDALGIGQRKQPGKRIRLRRYLGRLRLRLLGLRLQLRRLRLQLGRLRPQPIRFGLRLLGLRRHRILHSDGNLRLSGKDRAAQHRHHNHFLFHVKFSPSPI